ncbi:MAG: hypothetical protein SFV54_03015 [Bryobacteraceae bacterium]|nr:hypothetical protein [Bryobacteraceae bacterium]
MTLFASHIVVDWSAASRPVTGANSVWIAGGKQLFNPPTRAAALERLRQLLRELPKPLLCGFDFPLGFPRGSGRERLWAAIRDLLQDENDNRNNRFDVAVELNTFLPSPMFWGRPWQWRGHGLSPTRPSRLCLPEKRLTDRGTPQPVWKMSGAGSAGGQALTGIPRVLKLREEFAARLWPFDTGLCVPVNQAVVFAEVYPSMVPALPDPVRDRGQVRALARHFEKLDRQGALAPLFEPPLSAEQRRWVEADEGWILGVAAAAALG